MTKASKLLKRQAQWQKSRSQFSWPEKIRIAEQVRDSILKWRLGHRPNEKNEPVEPRGIVQEMTFFCAFPACRYCSVGHQ